VPTFTPWVLLTLVLAGPVAVQPEAGNCEVGVRHVELPAAPGGEKPALCISPERATLVSFDVDLRPGSVTLEGADRFIRVETGTSTLKLLPSEKVTAGERLTLTVGFQDGAAPTSATFELVVHADRAESLVNVYRLARPVESYAQELAETKARLRQLEAENARLRAESSGQRGLTGLIAAEIMDEAGVPSSHLMRGVTEAATKSGLAKRIVTYRSATRVAVKVVLKPSASAAPWTMEGKTLTRQGRKGLALKVVESWQSAPLVTGELDVTVVVEAEAPVDTSGPFTLRLWDASGTRTITLGGITFP
jgi:uncharacterized protein (TIGR02268 family)